MLAAPTAVAEVIEEATGVELVEDLTIGVLVEMAAGAEGSHHRPERAFVRDASRANFEQDRHVASVAEQLAHKPVSQKVAVVFAVRCTALDEFDNEERVLVCAEQIPGMQVALTPGLVGALDELPVVEARAEAGRDGLRVPGALVATEAVVGEAQGFREHPALAVVLGEEGFDAFLAIAAGILDFRFELVEGDDGQDGMAKLGVLVSVDAPKASRVRRRGVRNSLNRAAVEVENRYLVTARK